VSGAAPAVGKRPQALALGLVQAAELPRPQDVAPAGHAKRAVLVGVLDHRQQLEVACQHPHQGGVERLVGEGYDDGALDEVADRAIEQVGPIGGLQQLAAGDDTREVAGAVHDGEGPVLVQPNRAGLSVLRSAISRSAAVGDEGCHCALGAARFIEMLTYTAELVGIQVRITQESYSSKASFLDADPLPVYGVKEAPAFGGRRVQHGLY
jgi:hypothetical protein